jgi:hypothetical protein
MMYRMFGRFSAEWSDGVKAVRARQRPVVRKKIFIVDVLAGETDDFVCKIILGCEPTFNTFFRARGTSKRSHALRPGRV